MSLESKWAMQEHQHPLKEWGSDRFILARGPDWLNSANAWSHRGVGGS